MKYKSSYCETCKKYTNHSTATNRCYTCRKIKKSSFEIDTTNLILRLKLQQKYNKK